MSTLVPQWGAIKAHANTRVQELRDSLESASVDKVPVLQAEIRTWRQVLDLPQTLAPDPLEPSGAGYA